MNTSLGTLKKIFRGIALLTLTFFFLFTVLQGVAQMGGRASQDNGQARYGPVYNVSTETTVKGTVEEVQQLTSQTADSNKAMWANCPSGWTGTHVALKTEGGTLTVHVGPSAYLSQKNFTLAKGDKVTITGSKVQSQDLDFLIAKQITKGDQVLTLRDAKGFPLWAGARRMSPMPSPPTEE